MRKLTKLALAIGLMAVLAVGCSENPTLTAPEEINLNYQSLAAAVQLPTGATVTSATFNIYVTQTTGQPVDVHRITSDWDEMVVTWDNFGGAYAPEVIGTFVADGLGWRSVDVTSLVQDWADGTHEDFGLLLDQVEKEYPRTWYNSREAADNKPFLEVCYSVGGEEFCETAECVADAYLYELSRYDNYGSKTVLYTGWEIPTDFEKHSILRFDLVSEPPDDDEGCTLTIGYWKTHAGFGPQDDMVSALLPIWLGTADGDKSLNVEDAATAVEVLKMKTYGDESNGITKLYAQLLGAKLNLANGAGGSAVDETIADADAFLADNDWTAWTGLSDDDKDMVLDWKDTLDDYNNGVIGPGHCDGDDNGGCDKDKKKKNWNKNRSREHHRSHKGGSCGK